MERDRWFAPGRERLINCLRGGRKIGQIMERKHRNKKTDKMIPRPIGLRMCG